MDYDFVNNNDNHENSVEEFKMLDKNFFSYTKKVYDDKRKRYKNVKFGVYASGPMGSQIRNAETGVYYNDIVGSVGEDLYYKVIDTTGRFSKTPLTFFYDNKSQYDNYMNHN
jgi:hypothetical protein